jgi:hypothetical protein
MSYTVGTYGVYLALSITLTVWVAQTLHSNGRLFLMDVFGGRTELADAVNHLLRVGFYLINLGYVALALKLGYEVRDTRASIEALGAKVGFVLLVLGCMHIFNLLVFGAIRHRSTWVRAQAFAGRPEPSHLTGAGQPAARSRESFPSQHPTSHPNRDERETP